MHREILARKGLIDFAYFTLLWVVGGNILEKYEKHV